MSNASIQIKTDGECSFCHKTFPKRGMTKHLASCAQRPPAKEGVGATTWFRLLVEGEPRAIFWLYLDAPENATLADVDGVLRDVWLECCGHLSEFTIGELRFGMDREEDFGFFDVVPSRPMHKTKLKGVLRPKVKFHHEYDFGSTTRLTLTVSSVFDGPAVKVPEAKVAARNIAPIWNCGSCGEPAALICSQCNWDDQGYLCKRCARKHECGEDMLLPAVNSPRAGVCGYTG